MPHTYETRMNFAMLPKINRKESKMRAYEMKVVGKQSCIRCAKPAASNFVAHETKCMHGNENVWRWKKGRLMAVSGDCRLARSS